jgi:hypothetical protein
MINEKENNGIEYDIDKIQMIWNCNILMLLKLKRIKNDENYGTLITYTSH